MYKIDKGFPTPFGKHAGSRKTHQIPDSLWDKMEVGDSVLFPFLNNSPLERKLEMSRISQLRTRAQFRLPGRKFTLRTLDDGYRVWRVQ